MNYHVKPLISISKIKMNKKKKTNIKKILSPADSMVHSKFIPNSPFLKHSPSQCCVASAAVVSAAPYLLLL